MPIIDFSIPYLSAKLSPAEYAYLLQSAKAQINFLPPEQLAPIIQTFADQAPTVLLLPQSYAPLPPYLQNFPIIYHTSNGKTETSNWENLQTFRRAIISPVSPITGQALDVEEIVFSIRNARPDLQILLEITYLLGAEPFYFDAWQIDNAYCQLEKGEWLFAVSSSEGDNKPVTKHTFDYLPERWNRCRQRAAQFRQFLKKNDFSLPSFAVQTFAFTVFAFSSSNAANLIAEKLLKQGLRLPLTPAGDFAVSHMVEDYDENIFLLQEKLTQISAEIC